MPPRSEEHLGYLTKPLYSCYLTRALYLDRSCRTGAGVGIKALDVGGVARAGPAPGFACAIAGNEHITESVICAF